MKLNKTIFPELPDELRRNRLARPEGRVWAVLDTDTFNEIDDQFALAYAMLSPEKLDMKAICAAPFDNHRSSGPADGMEKSYQEIYRVLELLENGYRKNFVFRGATGYLKDRNTPFESAAAWRIVELARQAKAEGRVLYVLSIAAITNVASALLLAPDIVESIVVIWLGGHAYYVGDNREFNLIQDVPAAQVVFDSGVPLVHIPCAGVAENLGTTITALEKRTAGCGELGAFLLERTSDYLRHDLGVIKVIWDIATVAWFMTPEALKSEIVPAPVLNDDSSWSTASGRHEIRLIKYILTNEVFGDMFSRFETFAVQQQKTTALAL